MQQTKLHKEVWKLQSTIMNKSQPSAPILNKVWALLLGSGFESQQSVCFSHTRNNSGKGLLIFWIIRQAAMFIPDLQTVKKCLADSNMMSIYHAKGFYS